MNNSTFINTCFLHMQECMSHVARKRLITISILTPRYLLKSFSLNTSIVWQLNMKYFFIFTLIFRVETAIICAYRITTFSRDPMRSIRIDVSPRKFVWLNASINHYQMRFITILGIIATVSESASIVVKCDFAYYGILVETALFWLSGFNDLEIGYHKSAENCSLEKNRNVECGYTVYFRPH